MDPLKPSPQPQGAFVSPLLISLGIVASVSLIILAYHHLLVKFCVRRRRRSTSDNSLTMPAVQGCEMRIGGVEEHVLEAIPILLYSKDNIKLQAKVDHDQTECVVCLGELEEGNEVRSLPNCGHVFHVPCIDDWLSAHTNCPICRAPIVSAAPSSPTHDIASVFQESPSLNIGRRDHRTTQNLAQFLEQGEEDGSTISSTSANSVITTSTLHPSRKLLHSLSLVLPMEGKQQSFKKLKRSLSMDQSFIIIDIQRREDHDHEKDSSSSTSSTSSSSSSSSQASNSSSSLNATNVLLENRSYRATSMKQVDLVSSRLLRSFSQIRFGQSAMATHDLPC